MQKPSQPKLRGILARSVALLFYQSGILPQEARSLASDTPAPGLLPVLIKAWQHLRQTKAPFDKWLLYFSTILYIAVAAAFLIGCGVWLISKLLDAQP